MAVGAALALALAACAGTEVELSTTSSLITGTTTPADPVTTTPTSLAEATSTTLRGEPVLDYEVKIRESTENGEVLFILIPQGAYTDVDLENFINDLHDSIDGLWGAEVFDNADAVDAFRIPGDQRTDAQQALVDRHHFIGLVNGDTVRFAGPFAAFGEYVLGS